MTHSPLSWSRVVPLGQVIGTQVETSTLQTRVPGGQVTADAAVGFVSAASELSARTIIRPASALPANRRIEVEEPPRAPRPLHDVVSSIAFLSPGRPCDRVTRG